MNAARLNAAVSQRRRRDEPEPVPLEAGSLSRFTNPPPSPATRAALTRNADRLRALRRERAAQGRCVECGAHGHTVNRCPTIPEEEP